MPKPAAYYGNFGYSQHYRCPIHLNDHVLLTFRILFLFYIKFLVIKTLEEFQTTTHEILTSIPLFTDMQLVTCIYLFLENVCQQGSFLKDVATNSIPNHHLLYDLRTRSNPIWVLDGHTLGTHQNLSKANPNLKPLRLKQKKKRKECITS